jgi:hypothetical protein
VCLTKFEVVLIASVMNTFSLVQNFHLALRFGGALLPTLNSSQPNGTIFGIQLFDPVLAAADAELEVHFAIVYVE